MEQDGADYFYGTRAKQPKLVSSMLEGNMTYQKDFILSTEGGEHSISQMWASDDSEGSYSDVEFGWINSPHFNGSEPTLFVFRFDHGTAGECYNACGFVQTSNTTGHIAGYPISGPASLFNIGATHHLQIYAGAEGSKTRWYVAIDGEVVGYYPASAWTRQVMSGINREEAGGEVASSPTNAKPQTTMGDGYPGTSEASAYWSDVSDSEGAANLQTNGENAPAAYSVGTSGSFAGAGPAGSNFRFGGPGWCDHGSPGYCGAPSVTTEAATSIQETQVTLHGSVNPDESETNYYFQYGETAAYGSSTSEGAAGSGTSSVPEQASLSHLEPNEVYHYRLVASSPAGTSYGTDRTFTTLETEANSNWVAHYPLTNETSAFFVGAAGGRRVCYWRYNREWNDNCLTGETVSKGSTPTVLTEPLTSETTAFFVGSAGGRRVCYWGYNREWNDNCLTGETVAEGSPLSVVNYPSTSEQKAFFIGSSGRVCYWSYNRGWNDNCLTGEAVAKGSGLAAVTEPATNETTTFFVGAAGGRRVCYWGYNREWNDNCLTGETVAEGSALSVVNYPSTNEQKVFFIGSSGRVCYWSYNRGWNDNCLTGETVAKGSSLAAVTEPATNETTVFFVGAAGGRRVCYWGYNREWNDNCLTGETVAEGSGLAALNYPSTSEQKAFFIGSTNRVCYWSYNRQWNDNCLVGETLAEGSS